MKNKTRQDEITKHLTSRCTFEKKNEYTNIEKALRNFIFESGKNVTIRLIERIKFQWLWSFSYLFIFKALGSHL